MEGGEVNQNGHEQVQYFFLYKNEEISVLARTTPM